MRYTNFEDLQDPQVGESKMKIQNDLNNIRQNFSGEDKLEMAAKAIEQYEEEYGYINIELFESILNGEGYTAEEIEEILL